MSKYFHHRWKRNAEPDIPCLPVLSTPNIVFSRLHGRDRKILKFTAIFILLLCIFINYKIYTFDGPWDNGCALVSRNRFQLSSSNPNHPMHMCNSNSRLGKARVPNIVHYILTNNESVEFPFMYYVSIMSTYNILQPDEILFHYVTKPKGEWFERAREYITLVEVGDVTSVFGNPVEVPAHKSDILRMSALLKYGGIYLDLDVIIVRPFTPLLDYSFVMGYMASLPGYFNKFDNLLRQKRFHINGINNAVIISEANSAFLSRWFNTYRTFDDTDWSYHSVEVPSLLADKYPDEILVMAPNAFYYPTAENFGDFYNKQEYDFTNNFAVHLWNHLIADKYVNIIQSEEHVMNLHSSFGSLLRYVLKLNSTKEFEL